MFFPLQSVFRNRKAISISVRCECAISLECTIIPKVEKKCKEIWQFLIGHDILEFEKKYNPQLNVRQQNRNRKKDNRKKDNRKKEKEK